MKQIASIIQRESGFYTCSEVGGLVFRAIGQLLPHQMADFHSAALYPVGYEATRIYWSLRTNNRRCCYRCSIGENNGRRSS